MTLIIGIRATDGVALGSDRKILRGGETDFSEKIFILNHVALAVEGLTGIRDDFLYLLELELKRRRGVDTLYEMKVVAEDIISDLAERYRDRIRQESPIGVLMAGLEYLTYGAAKLYYIHGVGYGETVDFLCTGHGGPYATSLAKFILDKGLGSYENSKRIAFVISWVAEDVDATVGGRPYVVYIRDSNHPVNEPINILSDEDINDAINKSKYFKQNLAKIIFQHDT